MARKPDAVAACRRGGENGRVVYAHEDLIADDFGEALRLGIFEGDVVDIAVGWVALLWDGMLALSRVEMVRFSYCLEVEAGIPVGVVVLVDERIGITT